MPFLSYTIFSDIACTQARRVIHAQGENAVRLLRSLSIVKGSEPRERDVIAGCRIDRIGSEERDAS